MWRSAILGAELNPEVRDIRGHRLSANQNRAGFVSRGCLKMGRLLITCEERDNYLKSIIRAVC